MDIKARKEMREANLRFLKASLLYTTDIMLEMLDRASDEAVDALSSAWSCLVVEVAMNRPLPLLSPQPKEIRHE